MSIKDKLHHWRYKPRTGEFWNFTNWVYEDKNAFRILMVYGHIASILLFGSLTILFYFLGFNPVVIIVLAIFTALAIWKAKKLYKMHKSGVLDEFSKEYSLKDFAGGENEIRAKSSAKSNGNGFTEHGKAVHGGNSETERDSRKPKRTCKSISFSLLVDQESGRKAECGDTDTLDPDGD